MHKHTITKFSLLSRKTSWHCQNRHISTKLLSSLPNGTKMYRLENNLHSVDYPDVQDEKIMKERYANDSLNTLKLLLNPNCHYIIVDKAVKLAGNDTYGGHIASFLTDPNSGILKNSCVSLRPSNKIPNTMLQYNRSEIGDHQTRYCKISNIEFVDTEEELNKIGDLLSYLN